MMLGAGSAGRVFQARDEVSGRACALKLFHMAAARGSLAERLGHGALPAPAVCRLALDLVAGLELAHQRGVIHRDIKPANIFFDARGTAKRRVQ